MAAQLCAPVAGCAGRARSAGRGPLLPLRALRSGHLVLLRWRSALSAVRDRSRAGGGRVSPELPLAAAQRRLARAPGRPRTRPALPVPVQEHADAADRAVVRGANGRPAAPPVARVRVK